MRVSDLPVGACEDIAGRYRSGDNAHVIGRIYGLHPQQVLRIVRKQGVAVRAQAAPRRYSLDESFFESIDTERKAYWLGFIVADGHIPRSRADGRPEGIVVQLRASDAYHLGTFLCDLASDASVTYLMSNGRPAARASVYSRNLVAPLVRAGLTSGKSASTTFPDNLPRHLLKHFVRGYFDGNGWAFATSKCLLGMIGNPVLLGGVRRFLAAETGAPSTMRPHGTTPWLSVLRWSGCRASGAIAHYLYDGAERFLDRKKSRIEEIYLRERTSADRRLRKMSRADVESMVHLYRDGHPIADLLERYRVSKQTLYRHVHSAGIPLRNYPLNTLSEPLTIDPL